MPSIWSESKKRVLTAMIIGIKVAEYCHELGELSRIKGVMRDKLEAKFVAF